MTPLSIIRLILKFNDSKKEKPEEPEDAPSVKVEEEEELANQEEPNTLEPLRASGYRSFLEMSDDALKVWSAALRAKPAQVEDSTSEAYLSQDDPSGVASLSIPIPSRSTKETGSGTSLWGLLLLGMTLAVSRFGLRKGVLHGYETIVSDDFTKPLDEISQLKDFKEAISQFGTISGEQVGEVHFSEGTLFDKMQLTSYRITSEYGERRGSYVHRAIDVATPTGTPVRSPFDGVVVYTAKDRPKAGNYVEVVSEDGKYGFRFLHLSSILVSPGDRISKGQVIALTGNTYGGAKREDGSDWGTGAHLHIEAREFSSMPEVGESIFRKGKIVNPLLYGGEVSEFFLESNEPKSLMPSISYVPINNETVKGSPNVRVTSVGNSAIGIRGKNLMSVTTTPEASSRNPWVGQIGYTFGVNSLSFPVFQDYATALRAGAINLGKFQTVYDVSNSGGEYTTIADIAHNAKGHSYVTTANGDRINDWVDVVSKVSGFSPSERIDLMDVDTMARVVKGISMVEHSADVNLEDIQNVLRFYKVSNILASNKQ